MLQVTPRGNATRTLTAPHIKDVALSRGKSLVIHIGGVNCGASRRLWAAAAKSPAARSSKRLSGAQVRLRTGLD
jgi:Cu/Zn superoxide dismutase